MESSLYFVLGLLSLTSLYFFLRCRTMAGAVRRTNRALKEISGELEANRVLKLPAPDREMEELLVTINEALRKIREQHLEYAKREQEFQRQIENISHDLRTPLTSMKIGYLDIMDKTALDPEDREALEVVKRKARFLQQLVGQFYELSRFSGEDDTPRVEHVDIARLLRETIVDYYPESTARNLLVDINIMEGPVNVRADKDGLERVFQNLLQNVCRYAGREKLSVRRIERAAGQSYLLRTMRRECQRRQREGCLAFLHCGQFQKPGKHRAGTHHRQMSDRENGRYADGCKRRKVFKIYIDVIKVCDSFVYLFGG